ncbi:type II toxin-antitoxin system Phd/YefM family antitoxin [Ruegeria atlantica]|uniref:type II toxin-antitoxin system Phd/YefM family antitoxin n=1 Tax=Ruegeria atlantica TaxID=81569 RepID=UPI0014809182|nr:type II toxin-antitoxin system prevent-host-death family antitoxin [Ruegeria atlantica]
MDVMTYTDARKELKGVMDRVINDAEEIVVTRKNRESVVMVSLETWNSIQETMHLLSTPNNATRLRASIAQLDAGKGDKRDLIE